MTAAAGATATKTDDDDDDEVASVSSLPNTGGGAPNGFDGANDLLILFGSVVVLGAAGYSLRRRMI